MPSLIRKYAEYILDPEDAADEPEVQIIEVRSADQIKAEQMARTRGIPPDAVVQIGHLWLWAALVRTGATEAKFDDFVQTVIQATITDGSEDDVVPPTSQAASDDSA